MKIVIIIVLFLVLIAGCFWFALRSVTEDVSDKAPYAEMLNHSVLTTKEMVLAKNLPEFISSAGRTTPSPWLCLPTSQLASATQVFD